MHFIANNLAFGEAAWRAILRCMAIWRGSPRDHLLGSSLAPWPSHIPDHRGLNRHWLEHISEGGQVPVGVFGRATRMVF